MNRFIPALAAACFALAATTSFAQMSGGGGEGKHMGRHHMTPCSQEADPAKCEANRKQKREQFRAAHEACKDAKDKHACMTDNYCGKQADPAQCKAKAAEHKGKMAQHMNRRQAIAEACTGKRDEALQQCYRDQRAKSGTKK